MPLRHPNVRTLAAVSAVFICSWTPAVGAQDAPNPRQPRVSMDSARIAALCVSDRPADLPKADYDRQIVAKRRTDSIYAARSAGVMEFRKVTYRSRADGKEIPAYL